MDVMMPNFNGLKALEELKSKPETQNIPVIMLSANDDDAIVQKALGLGAARYLFKDKLEPSQVIQIIKEVMAKH
jgi:CheY-like chemotaxis protein